MSKLNTNFIAIAIIFLVVIITALPVFIMEPDAAIYAEISRELLINDWYMLTYNNTEFLDKPHLPFWFSALSMSLFGVNNIAFKLPALIFSLSAIFYTYLSAKFLYNKKVAFNAVLIFITTFHFVLNINDVRAEPFVMASIISSFYYLLKCFSINNLQKQILLLSVSSVIASLAFMSKGLFTLIPLVTVILFYILINLNLAKRYFLFSLYFISIVLLCSLPVLLAYYLQFDIKQDIVFNLFSQGYKENISGIKFFLWDSQLGRFLNAGPIKSEDSSNIFYYINALLWAFSPWAIILFITFTKNCIKYFSLSSKEQVLIFATFPLFIIFSLSKFQLPHYVVILFPFFAIIVAKNIYRVSSMTLDISLVSFALLATFAWIIIVMLNNYNYAIVIISIFTIFVYLFFALKIRFCKSKKPNYSIFKLLIYSSLGFYIFVNLFFYPRLSDFQASNGISEYIKSNNLLSYPIYNYNAGRLSVEFQLNKDIKILDNINNFKFKNAVVLADINGKEDIMNIYSNSKVLKKFFDFPITTINIDFVNPKTRENTLKPIYLILLSK